MCDCGIHTESLKQGVAGFSVSGKVEMKAGEYETGGFAKFVASCRCKVEKLLTTLSY